MPISELAATQGSTTFVVGKGVSAAGKAGREGAVVLADDFAGCGSGASSPADAGNFGAV